MAVERAEVGIKAAITHAVGKVEATIRARYPEARFKLLPGVETDMWQLNAYINDSEEYELLDLIGDKLTDLLIQRDIAIYIVPLPLSAYKEAAS